MRSTGPSHRSASSAPARSTRELEFVPQRDINAGNLLAIPFLLVPLKEQEAMVRATREEAEEAEAAEQKCVRDRV